MEYSLYGHVEYIHVLQLLYFHSDFHSFPFLCVTFPLIDIIIFNLIQLILSTHTELFVN